MKHCMLWAVFFAMAGSTFGQTKAPRQPVIDIHLHAESLANLRSWGPNPVTGENALHLSKSTTGRLCRR